MRGVLFVTKQFTFFVWLVFWNSLLGCFHLERDTWVRGASPTAEAHQQKDAYFLLIFFLVLLEKMRALSQAKDAEFLWVGSILWPVPLVCYKIMVKTYRLDICISLWICSYLKQIRFCFAYFLLCLFMPVNSQLFFFKDPVWITANQAWSLKLPS